MKSRRTRQTLTESRSCLSIQPVKAFNIENVSFKRTGLYLPINQISPCSMERKAMNTHFFMTSHRNMPQKISDDFLRFENTHQQKKINKKRPNSRRKSQGRWNLNDQDENLPPKRPNTVFNSNDIPIIINNASDRNSQMNRRDSLQSKLESSLDEEFLALFTC